MSLTLARLEESRILMLSAARQEYKKYGYIEFNGQRIYKDSLSKEITEETAFRDSIGFGSTDRYKVITAYRSEEIILVGANISDIQTYWIGESKDFTSTITNPFPQEKHRRQLITMKDGSVIRVREISKVYN